MMRHARRGSPGGTAGIPPEAAIARDIPSERISRIQRSRLVAAAIGALEEEGYERATVAHITRRARVSRRTFYQLFSNREECVAAILQETAARVAGELDADGLDGLSWRERMRQGLWVILNFLDSEPMLARVIVVHSLHSSGLVLEAREAIVERLIAVVDEGRREDGRGAGRSVVTAEGVVGAALAILYARVAGERREPLTALLGELMGIVVLPYQGPAAARREQMRAAPGLPAAGRRPAGQDPPPSAADPLAELRMRLTYRTARVLEGIAEHPGASNRQIAEHAGIHDQGQISKLLARLQRLGLLVNHDHETRQGEPNAWRLTATGTAVTRSIAAHISGTSERRAA